MFPSCDIFSVIWTALVLCGSPAHIWNGKREGVWVSKFNSSCMKRFINFNQFKPDITFENLNGQNFSLSKEQIKNCIKVCKIPNLFKNDVDLRKLNSDFSPVKRYHAFEDSTNITSEVSRTLYDSNCLSDSSLYGTCNIDFKWQSYQPFNSSCYNDLLFKNFSKDIQTCDEDENKSTSNNTNKENFIPVIWYKKSSDKCYLSRNKNQSFQISKEKTTNKIKDLSRITENQFCRILNFSIIHKKSNELQNKWLKKRFRRKPLSYSLNYLRKPFCLNSTNGFSKKRISLKEDISKDELKSLDRTVWNNTHSFKQKFCASKNLYECSLEPKKSLSSNDSEC